MPNSKTRSSWYQNNSSGELIAHDDHVNDLSQAKTYRIVGKNIRNFDLPKDVITIGDGNSYVDLKEQNIEAGSRVMINAHGGFSSGKSTIDLEETEGFTSYAFQNLVAVAGGAALNVEVFTCHGGYAINNIVDLPKGSSLMTFIDDQDSSFSSDSKFLQDVSFKFQDPENQFMRFASYLLTSPHITKFAIRGHNGNHFFFCDPDSRESYGIDDIKLWQKDLLKEYAEFLSSIKEDLAPLNKAQIDKVIELVENEAELNQFIENFDTKQYIVDYLIGKAGNNRVEEVKNILNKGADVNAVNKDAWSALHLAAQKGNLELVKELLRHKDINVYVVNKDGFSALHIAAQQGHLKVVRELLQCKDIDVNVVTKNGFSALHIAAQKGHLEVVRELLHSGLDVNLVTKNDFSALHIAAQQGHLEVVRELLQRKDIDVNLVTKNGFSALHLAAQNGHLEVVRELLQRKDIDVNLVTKNGFSALHIAAQKGHLEVVRELLLHKDIDVNIIASVIKTNQSTLLEAILQKDVESKELEKFLQVVLDSNNLDMANQISSNNLKISDNQALAIEGGSSAQNNINYAKNLLGVAAAGAIAVAGNYAYSYYKKNYGKDASSKQIDEAKEMLSELLNSDIDSDKMYKCLNSCNDYLVHKLNDMYDKKTQNSKEYDALREALSQVSELKDNVLALEKGIEGLKVARQELDKSNVKKEQYVNSLIEEKKNLDDMCLQMMSKIEEVEKVVNQPKEKERDLPTLEEVVEQYKLEDMRKTIKQPSWTSEELDLTKLYAIPAQNKGSSKGR